MSNQFALAYFTALFHNVLWNAKHPKINCQLQTYSSERDQEYIHVEKSMLAMFSINYKMRAIKNICTIVKNLKGITRITLVLCQHWLDTVQSCIFNKLPFYIISIFHLPSLNYRSKILIFVSVSRMSVNNNHLQKILRWILTAL